ncbi:GTP-binding protein, partial [Klebsiella pneumoniae]
RPWNEDETRQSTLVFIGIQLPEEEIRANFDALMPSTEEKAY